MSPIVALVPMIILVVVVVCVMMLAQCLDSIITKYLGTATTRTNAAGHVLTRGVANVLSLILMGYLINWYGESKAWPAQDVQNCIVLLSLVFLVSQKDLRTNVSTVVHIN